MKSIIIPLALLLSIPVMARDNGTGPIRFQLALRLLKYTCRIEKQADKSRNRKY